MAKRGKCSICKTEKALFYCILCDSFFCGNCNVVVHDEKCPTKQRSSELKSQRRRDDSIKRWIESSESYTTLQSKFLSRYDTNAKESSFDCGEGILTSRITFSEEKTMSVQKKISDCSRRAPVPCPRLPASFKSSTKDTHANYSYASIEFRPAIVTDDGVMAAPKDEQDDDNFNNDFNNDDYQWEDEVQTYSPVDVDPYAEIEIGPGFEAPRHHNSSDGETPPKLPPRYDSNERIDQLNDPTFEIYEDPADTRPNDVDLSQLYAVVDFSKKKKKSQKSSVDTKEYTSQPQQQQQQQQQQQPQQPDSESVYSAVEIVGKQNFKDIAAKSGVSEIGNSKFFVDIPKSREGTPPPVPKPYAAQRKKSAPALLYQELPPLPPRTREVLKGDIKCSRSNDNIHDSYATVEDVSEKKSVKGHRRNLSGDLHIGSRDLHIDLTGGQADRGPLTSSEKRSFKKKHRRMKSHETISTVFSPNHKGSKTDLTSTEKELSSPTSGQSGAASPLEDASVSKESHDSVENSYDDMSEIMRKAEALISDELPEGWQEVRDGSEVYYWHIWTGTIQYERPILSATPSSSSRSLSPSFSDPSSSQSPCVTEAQEKGMQSKSPEARPESPHDKPRQAISFPVHSMGWTDVEEDQMTSNVLAETVNDCISSLAEQRKDLWKISDTWGEGKDIKLILEGESLKLVEPKSKALLLVQPIAKMRVWGVGKEDQRDFAFIARDQKTNKHKCHMFRCHGNVSGRSIANTLHTICNRVLEEKRRAKEKNTKAQKAASDLLNAPVSSSARGNSAFNEKPYFEQKKRFSAKYIGWTEVSKSSGIDTLNKAVNKLFAVREPSDWKTVLVEITTSEIKTIDCSTQEVLMEDRVRFISFLGVAKDERMCGYIVAVGMETFVCHVFCCIPHAGTLTRAIEEACKLRYEKFLYKNSEEKSDRPEIEKNLQQFQERLSVKEKGSVLKSSVQGFFQKLQKKDSKKKDEASQFNQDYKGPALQPGVNEYLVKYFGCVQVELGTGIETLQESVEQLSGGAMMIGYLEVTKDGLTLCDSQRTALSCRVIDLDTVSYCGITSDKQHFGVIVSQGRGKYACHVCQEYKTPVGNIVCAIHSVL